MRRLSSKVWLSTIAVIVGIVALILWSPWSSAEPTLSLEQAQQKLLTHYSGKIESASATDDQYEMRLRTDTGLYAVALSASSGDVQSIQRLEATEQTRPEVLGHKEVKKLVEQQTNGGELKQLELQNEVEGKTPTYVAVLTDPAGRTLQLTVDAYSGDTLAETELAPAPKPNKPPSSNPTDSKPTDEPDDPKDNKPVRLLNEKEAEEVARRSLANAGSPIKDIDADFRTEDDGQAYYLVEVELEDDREASVQVNAVSGAVQSTTWDGDDDS
ncbi:PepSY domain-containing protein [Saccharibacillus sp. JS10]|uniref:PepSY domain-containing protein n=1 Tax=Saccharibacillus sp. JS10 TaxID=2950552 RepID=UPI00210ADF77|nr:PepSY domain-containing protein [Saccharibacillus sp. JS10]MCQ4088226.1 PepSY domain-containing protein [Saccharibacillus sp. JS10]